MNAYDTVANWLDDNYDIDSHVEIWRIIAALREEAGKAINKPRA